MGNEKITELVGSTLEFAKGVLKKDNVLAPVALLVAPSGVTVVPIKFDSDAKKHTVYTAIGSACRRIGATHVVLVNDAAMRTFDKGADYEKVVSDPTEAPLTYPKSMRTEVVMVLGHELGTDRTEFLMQPYKDEGGKVEFLDEPAKGDEFTGFKSGLIDDIENGYSRLDRIRRPDGGTL